MELHQGNMFPFKSRFKSTCGVCSLTRSELSETPGRRVLVCLSNQNPRLKCPVLELFDSPLCVCNGQKHVLKKLAHFLKRQGKVKGQSEEYYWWRWRFVFAFGGGGGSSLTSRSPKNIPELVKGWLSVTYRCACEWFISTVYDGLRPGCTALYCWQMGLSLGSYSEPRVCCDGRQD